MPLSATSLANPSDIPPLASLYHHRSHFFTGFALWATTHPYRLTEGVYSEFALESG
jgi:hypothetical protein